MVMKRLWLLYAFLIAMCISMIPDVKANAKDKVFYFTDETKEEYQKEESIIIGADNDFSSWHTNDYYPNVKEIQFEEGITALDRYVFFYFPNVTKVTLPMSLTDLRNAMESTEETLITEYQACLTKLEQFEADISNPVYMTIDGVLYSKDQTELISYPAGKKNETYIMPEFVTNVDENAFGDNAYLQEIVFGTRYQWNQRYSRSYYSFLPNLKEFSVAKDNICITAVDGVLYNAEMTKLLAYPKGKKVKKFVIPETVTDIEDGAFEGVQIDTLVLPKELSFIDYSSDSRFRSNQVLAFSITDGTYLSTQDGVVYNKDKTQLAIWPGRKKETTLRFPSTVKRLPLTSDYIPQECLQKVTELVIPKNATFMFYEGGLESLKKITVEKGNQSYTVYDDLLYSKDLKELYLMPVKADKSTLEIPKAFKFSYVSYGNNEMTSVKKIVVNGGGTDFPYELFPNLKEIELGEGNTKAKVDDGVLYSADNKKLIWYPQAKTDKSYTVPSTVTAIADHAFAASDYLETITLPDKLKLEWNNNRTNFTNCKKLKEIKVSSGNSYLTSVDGVLYTKDKSFLLCYPSEKTDKNYTMPDTVKDFVATKNAYLTSITLGAAFEDFYYPDYDLDGGLIGFNNLEQITVSDKNTQYSSIQGVLYRKDSEGLALVIYPMGKKDKVFTIPSNVYDVWFDCRAVWKVHSYLEVLKSDSNRVNVFGKEVDVKYY